MLQPVLVILLAAVIFSALLAKRLSRRIVEPLNAIDLDHPLEAKAYDEIAPLLGRINRQHEQIDDQLRRAPAQDRRVHPHHAEHARGSRAARQ